MDVRPILYRSRWLLRLPSFLSIFLSLLRNSYCWGHFFYPANGRECFSCQLKHIKTNISPLDILEMAHRECSKSRVCSSSILHEHWKVLCWTFCLWQFNQRTKSTKFVVIRCNFICFPLLNERSVKCLFLLLNKEESCSLLIELPNLHPSHPSLHWQLLFTSLLWLPFFLHALTICCHHLRFLPRRFLIRLSA